MRLLENLVDESCPERQPIASFHSLFALFNHVFWIISCLVWHEFVTTSYRIVIELVGRWNWRNYQLSRTGHCSILQVNMHICLCLCLISCCQQSSATINPCNYESIWFDFIGFDIWWSSWLKRFNQVLIWQIHTRIDWKRLWIELAVFVKGFRFPCWKGFFRNQMKLYRDKSIQINWK